MEQNKNILYEVLCLGTGGTGGYFLEIFSKALMGGHSKIRALYMMDGDRVEKKNLERQAFLEEDIGEYKASVLASVLNDQYRLNWKAYPEYLISINKLEELFTTNNSSVVPVIIGCVDNHGARLVMEEFFKTHDNCIYFDSANEMYSGEIIYSYKLNGRQLSPLRSEVFPDILKGDTRNVTEISCEELNNSSPQHIYTNMRAGLSLAEALTFLLEDKVYPGMEFFNGKLKSFDFNLLTKEGQ